ncbi:MAG: PD-(D/E)XK nuclease family protein, partial [Solirubrobacterales bacterium]
DLRGLLDFLSSRAEADAEAEAASAVEGHDGVRIMTVHNAKGLEFDVVAVPDLSRSLLAGSRQPLLTLGREAEPSAGLQLRRLGAPSINLYAYAQLCEEAKQRDAEEGLRLFHVAATRARERLILSGIVKPAPNGETKPATPILDRIVDGLGIGREADSTVEIPPPAPRAGLEASFPAAEMAVCINLPSPARAAELAATRRDGRAEIDAGEGPTPLVDQRPPTVPNRPLSYSAIAAFEECGYRFQLERVLGLGSLARNSQRVPELELDAPVQAAQGRRRQAAHGAAVHSLLEWSQANGWREPPEEVVRHHAAAASLDLAPGGTESLLEPVRKWLDSPLFHERVQGDRARVRAETPLLLTVAGTVLRGSIDLLVEAPGDPPLVIDYKTDRLNGAGPAERAAHYTNQRNIYALAVAEARGAAEVEVAYVFLERPAEPVCTILDGAMMGAGRQSLVATIERIRAGDFQPAPAERRDWALCDGCPALKRMCSGPPTN